jgi:hypothetical protein
MLLDLRSLFFPGEPNVYTYAGSIQATATVAGNEAFYVQGAYGGALWRLFYTAPTFAGAVRGRFRAEGEIGIPGPALPGLSRLRPTFRTTEDRFTVSVYGYVGRIDALSTVAALWSFTANPVELVTATSGIAAAVSVTWNPAEAGIAAQSGVAGTDAATWNPAELIAAQSTLSVTQKFVAVPPASLSTTSSVAASYSFEAAGGPVTYAYAGLIAAQSTISAVIVGPATVSRGPVPMRRVRPRSWTRVEFPMLYREAGQVAAVASVSAAASVTASPTTAVAAEAGVSAQAATRQVYRGQVATRSSLAAASSFTAAPMTAVAGARSLVSAAVAATRRLVASVAAQARVEAVASVTSAPGVAIASHAATAAATATTRSYVGTIAIRRPQLRSVYRVAFSPPTSITAQRPSLPSVDAVIRQWQQAGLVGARAALSGAVRYHDRVGEIQGEDDDALLELLL